MEDKGFLKNTEEKINIEKLLEMDAKSLKDMDLNGLQNMEFDDLIDLRDDLLKNLRHRMNCSLNNNVTKNWVNKEISCELAAKLKEMNSMISEKRKQQLKKDIKENDEESIKYLKSLVPVQEKGFLNWLKKRFNFVVEFVKEASKNTNFEMKKKSEYRSDKYVIEKNIKSETETLETFFKNLPDKEMSNQLNSKSNEIPQIVNENGKEPKGLMVKEDDDDYLR